METSENHFAKSTWHSSVIGKRLACVPVHYTVVCGLEHRLQKTSQTWSQFTLVPTAFETTQSEKGPCFHPEVVSPAFLGPLRPRNRTFRQPISGHKGFAWFINKSIMINNYFSQAMQVHVKEAIWSRCMHTHILTVSQMKRVITIKPRIRTAIRNINARLALILVTVIP